MENNVYTRLNEKLGAPVSKRLLNILEEMFTPEEGELLLELFVPVTCPDLASKLKIDEKSLLVMLENLVDRGVLTKGKTKYAFHTSLLAFHHDVVGDTAVMPIPEKLRELWGDFFYNEWYDSFVENYIKRQAETGRSVHRVWPAIGALELSPNIRPEEILPEENWQLIIENAKRRIVAPCGCRAPWGKCDHPVMTCFANFDNDRGEYYLGKPGRQLEELSLEETMNRVRSLEEAGLVHVGACYCCPDACEILYSLTRAKRFDLLGPSRYLAVVDEELCNGCQGCVDRCYFDAVEMQKPAGSKKFKASIDKDKCLGCGLCIVDCKQKAMRFELVRPPEFIKDSRRQDKTPTDLWGFYHLD